MDNINTSLIVKWLRLPMALLVIFIHMTPHLNPHFTPVYSIDWQSLSPDNIYSIIGIFFNNLCTVAVPFFFFTAGYYFFEGGNLAASKIRNLECPSYEICLIDYGCGKFNRKIHIMEQYP